jgi:hypothetical protein
MKLNTSGILKLLISLLLIPSILGCTSSVAQPPKQESQGVSKASPIRVIVTFNRLPAANDQRLLPLLAESCNCTPVFFRQYLDNALIYEITLPQDMTYYHFQSILLERGAAQGVRGVEQDSLDKFQR